MRFQEFRASRGSEPLNRPTVRPTRTDDTLFTPEDDVGMASETSETRTRRDTVYWITRLVRTTWSAEVQVYALAYLASIRNP